eukprot:NODE_6134_length_1702_cov_3.699048.p7 GENE.NODE_6134_length_1702_cov_3.699048~~NODE_6134_length_1702_cov_3.699048.p7  ORF type:complete len:78 (-),score=15.97 NODE_6134_length_1702_cov_3.699048:1469-1675(-)
MPWSCARLVFVASPLLHALASSALRILRECDASELAITPWACASRLCYDAPLLAAISAESSAPLQTGQ